MKIILGLYIILYYAQLSNATLFHSKHSLSARSSAKSGRSLNLPRQPYHQLASAWFAGWLSEFTPSDVPWKKYDQVIYAFASTTSDSNIGLQPSDQVVLPEFVRLAKYHNVRPILAIGGWSGSRFFSSSLATPENRTAFAKAVMRTVLEYGLEGIEFDWEYPTKKGIGCNVASPDDSANFLSFLQLLRSMDVTNCLIISAAVSTTPFMGPDGQPMSDVSAFAAILDYIEIMNYDIWGSWSSSVGPNAPLDDSCAPSPQGSAKSAVKAWSAAGFSPRQIIIGVAAYGHSYFVKREDAYNLATGEIGLYVPFDNSKQPAGDRWDSTAGGVDECGNPGAVGGIFNFWALIEAGFLDDYGEPAEGMDYMFDPCSQTPFIYNPKPQVMVSYDDAHSFRAKGKYIREADLAGFAMWDAAGDYHDILLDAINRAMRHENGYCPS